MGVSEPRGRPTAPIWSRAAGGAPAALGPWGFGAQAGYYTDRETGLQLCGLRCYDPAQGRFLNRDPSGYAGGVNLYNCVHNSPTSLTDPLGLGDDDLWYDVSGDAIQRLQGAFDGAVNRELAQPDTAPTDVLFGRGVAGAADLVFTILRLPQLLAHVGGGSAASGSTRPGGRCPGW